MMGLVTFLDPEIRADRALARRVVAGDRDAFDELFSRHARSLYRYARARLPADPDLVEEIVQTTLVEAIESLSSYRGEGALAAWLYGICRFVISAHYRDGRRLTHVELSEEDPEIRAAAELLGGEPGRDSEQRQLAGMVHATLEALPGRYGDVLEWKYLDGLPVADIASRLGLSDKAAESLLTRARSAFRRTFAATTAPRSPARPSETHR